MSSRDKILNSIKHSMEEGRNYSIPSSNISSSVFPPPEPLVQTFKKELESIGGKIFLVEGMADLSNQLTILLKEKQLITICCIDEELANQLVLDAEILSREMTPDVEAGLTRCEYLVARTGTVVVYSSHPSGRRMNAFPPIHLVYAKQSQIVAFPEDALIIPETNDNQEKPSMISFITGASRTADIEKTLVMGAHGPKELYVFINKNA